MILNIDFKFWSKKQPVYKNSRLAHKPMPVCLCVIDKGQWVMEFVRLFKPSPGQGSSHKTWGKAPKHNYPIALLLSITHKHTCSDVCANLTFCTLVVFWSKFWNLSSELCIHYGAMNDELLMYCWEKWK